jgi:hypothetical protein
MSEQSDALNKFARDRLGAKADASAGGAPHLTVLGDQAATETEPQITWVRLPADGYQLSEFAREVGRIAKTNGVFRRDRIPVTVDYESGDIVEMSAERFRTYVERQMVTYKFKNLGDDGQIKVRSTMGVEVARGVLSADCFVEQQRALDRVNHVRMPAMREDGRIELLPEGYDESTRTFTMHSDVMIDEAMPLDRAREVLDALLSEFPFGDWEDGKSRSKAVALAAMMGVYGAGLQELSAKRMNFVYTANSQGSGKTLLAQIAVVPVWGKARIQSRPDNREEMRKVLDTAVANAAPYVFFDDLEGNLKDNTLNAFMTASVWSGRVLGTQRQFAAPKMAMCFLTGNNLTLSTDIARRTLLCELYVEESDPQARTVKKVIDEHWLDRVDVRKDLLSAMWSVIRHWDLAGRPACSRVLRGYEEWSRIFGGIVEWMGWGNALEPAKTENAGDTEWVDMQELVRNLVLDMGTEKAKEYDFSELLDCSRETECFSWLIEGKLNKDNEFEATAKCRSALGKLWSGKYGGRVFVVNGQRVRFGVRGRNRGRKYRIEIGA